MPDNEQDELQQRHQSPGNTAPESSSIDHLLSLSDGELTRRKLALETAKLEREEKEKREEGRFQKLAQKLAPYLTPTAAIVGIIASVVTAYTLVGNFNSALKDAAQRQTENAQKHFDDLVQSASRADNGTGQRIAGILSLRQYIGKTDYELVVASTLAGILAYDKDQGALDACVEAIGSAYGNNTPADTVKRIRSLFYGTSIGDGEPGGAVGVLMRNQIVLRKALVAGKLDDEIYSFRMHYFADAVRKNYRNLESVNLQDADLPNIHLYEADLKRSNMQNVNLSGVDTQVFESDFTHANLQNAQMNDVDGRGAIFDGARLQGIQLLRANFAPFEDRAGTNHYSSFVDCHLEGAILSGANFTKARLVQSHLAPLAIGAEFKATQLDHANLTDADLSGADVRGVNLTGSRLDNANLQDAIFSSPEALAGIGSYRGTPKFLSESP
jgi:uncharacterized protein YjbI with pentapeptide repeats